MHTDEQVFRLTVIDDEPDIARFISDVADMAGYEVSHYFDARLFVREYKANTDVIFIDLVMPDMSGLEVVEFLVAQHSPARLILMTGFEASNLDAAQKLAIAGGLNFVSGFKKPFRFDELLNLLNTLKSVP